jgi:hypothetical protein
MNKFSEDAKLVINEINQYSNTRDTLDIEFWYPRSNEIKYFNIGLMDVRAADSIRISYDFDRDGYKIEQASTFSWDCDDKVCDPDWQEVSFIQAWARQKKEEV